MHKKIIKKVMCVLLVLSLMFVSSFSVYYLTEVSLIYSEVISNAVFGYDSINDFNIKEFYSKEYKYDIDERLASSGYVTDVNVLLDYAILSSSGVIVKAKYLGRREVRGGGEFKFKVSEVLMNTGEYPIEKGEKIRYTAASDGRYYTFDEIVYHSYGMEYERGEEYILFLRQCAPNLQYSDNPRYVYMGGDLDRKIYRFACVSKLSGEYPSITIFPGSVEYDATYFGAENKYVTADEFVEMLSAELTRRISNVSV